MPTGKEYRAWVNSEILEWAALSGTHLRFTVNHESQENAMFEVNDPEVASAFLMSKDVVGKKQEPYQVEGRLGTLEYWHSVPIIEYAGPADFADRIMKCAELAPYEGVVRAGEFENHLSDLWQKEVEAEVEEKFDFREHDGYDARQYREQQREARYVPLLTAMLETIEGLFIQLLMTGTEGRSISARSKAEIEKLRRLVKLCGVDSLAQLSGVAEWSHVEPWIELLLKLHRRPLCFELQQTFLKCMGPESAPYVYRIAVGVEGFTESNLQRDMLSRMWKLASWSVREVEEWTDPKRKTREIQTVWKNVKEFNRQRDDVCESTIVVKFRPNRFGEMVRAGEKVICSFRRLRDQAPIFTKGSMRICVSEVNPTAPLPLQVRQNFALLPPLGS